MAFTPDEMNRRIRELLDANPVVDGHEVYLLPHAVKAMVDSLSNEELGELFRWEPVTIYRFAAMERATSRYRVPTDEVMMGLIEDIFLARLDEDLTDESIRRWHARLGPESVVKS